MNIDSAEYANIVLSFTRFYDQARRAGMAPLSASAALAAAQLDRRARSRGYWTHTGYMNWDTGLGFARWHQTKKLGLTQEALIGLARSDSLLPSRQWGRVVEGHPRPRPRVLRPPRGAHDRAACPTASCSASTEVPQGRSSARLGAAAHARQRRPRDRRRPRPRSARAEPPPLYAYDPDIGRLAVTTPTYNTAIVAVNQRAFPYGGLDLARLFDGNAGGRRQHRRPPARRVRPARPRHPRPPRRRDPGPARARVAHRRRPLRLTARPERRGR